MKTTRAEQIRAYILDNVEDNPTGIASQTAKKFKISRPGVHRHLDTLLDAGQLARIGHRRNTRYAKTTERQQAWVLQRDEITSVDDAWQQTCARKVRVFKSNIVDLFQWGFSEILQNARAHSTGSEFAVFYDFSGQTIHLSLLDDGRGIFAAYAEKHGIADLRDAALQILQGKTGKDTRSLSWCYKIFDSTIVRANGLEFCRFGVDDWYLDNTPMERHGGTLVQLSLDIATTKTLASVLQPGGTSPASQLQVFVKLLELNKEVYLTREDAKALMFDAEGYKEIILDFKSVKTVGHSFVKEIFGYYARLNPDIEISYVNANSNIKFMIERLKMEVH